MRELRYHQDYAARGDDSLYFEAAHRLTRMAFAASGIVAVPFELSGSVFDALERIENADKPVYTTSEVAALADFFEQVSARLDAALDAEGRPRDHHGDAIVEEAKRPLVFDDGSVDEDRVFELEEGGRIGTVYPRMALADFRDGLPRLTLFLRQAARDRLEVAVL